MSKATRAYLKERPVNSESQGSRSNPQSHSSTKAVAAEQKPTDPIARHPSMQIPSLSTDPGYHINCNSPTEDRGRDGIVVSHPDATLPSRRVSAKPNANSSIRGHEPAETPRLGMHSSPHLPPVRDEGGSGISVANSSKDHSAPGITGIEVTARGRCNAFGYGDN
jgi:hypothetical protein